MTVFHRVALSTLVPLALVGCGGMPRTQALSRDIVPALQPVDVRVGVKQPELYAAFVPSSAGATAAATCGAIPGLGILLAAACGGALGTVDAGINASRAKDAEVLVRPLKDELVDVQFDRQMTDALRESLLTVPGLQMAGVNLTKDVNDKSYSATFRSSEAGAVMYVNIDYHMSVDLSTLEVSARGMLFPRSANARKAAKLVADLPAADQVLSQQNAAYRMDVIYQARLPALVGATPTINRDTWKADGARLLRGSLDDGIGRVSRALAEDLRRNPAETAPVLRKLTPPAGVPGVTGAVGVTGDLLAEQDGGQLVRFPDGTLHYFTAAVALAAPVPPVSGEATAPAPASAASETTAPPSGSSSL